MYAKIQNNEILEWPIVNLRQRLPETSLPEVLTDANIPEGFVIVYYTIPPYYDSNTQKLFTDPKPQLVNGQWQIGYTVVALEPEQVAAQTAELANAVRQQRNDLLASSDWTQVADAPVDKQAWANYRQQLRDVTNQPGFPVQVDWPAQP